MRKFAKLYARNKTDENFELKKKYKNLQRKSAGKQLNIIWKTKSEKMKEKTQEIFLHFSAIH